MCAGQALSNAAPHKLRLSYDACSMINDIRGPRVRSFKLHRVLLAHCTWRLGKRETQRSNDQIREPIRERVNGDLDACGHQTRGMRTVVRCRRMCMTKTSRASSSRDVTKQSSANLPIELSRYTAPIMDCSVKCAHYRYGFRGPREAFQLYTGLPHSFVDLSLKSDRHRADPLTSRDD